MNSDLIEEIVRQPFNPILERLRYSLATLDEIAVTNEHDRKKLTAFAPVQSKMVMVLNQ
jgi:hypothetical protein